ncbi:MAG: [Fe] hydrogenase, large subunit HymC [Candidatus Falkowbacteria bacterium GW2011_GWF2_38_1205]|nr:MAG: [Fe] hydrogenase, large subunit HymC [Candidatus Falkowbacteria bacterium GW2011_GWF2_38_1205]
MVKSKVIKISINGKNYSCEQGDTIMKVAAKNGISIPGLCGHPDFKARSTCRLCVVEIKGRRNLATSCSTIAEDGMEITTDNDRVKKSRNTNLELIFAEHIEKCADCIWRFECKLLAYAKKFDLKLTRFNDRKANRQTYRFANAVEIDGTQCIDCRNCVDACTLLQKIDYLEIKGKGADQEIVPSSNKNKKCILCGQCAVHCPVSSAQEQANWKQVEREIANPDQIVIAQFAPSIRVSIGEDFGMPHGSIVTNQVVAGLRALGFDYVFDVNFGADITTIVEAKELIERLNPGNKKNAMPMITSCCPGWVNYVELYRPDLIPNLTTSHKNILGGKNEN